MSADHKTPLVLNVRWDGAWHWWRREKIADDLGPTINRLHVGPLEFRWYRSRWG